MADTSIQWTDKVWNPLRGCTEISPGCAHCYAAVLAARFSGPGQPYEGLAYFDGNHKAHWTGKVMLAEGKLEEPKRWRKPVKVFVNSMSDLFHEDVPDAWIDAVFRVMADTPHTYQVLTKRAERMAEYCNARWTESRGIVWKMPPNVWLGISVEDQKRADERIPHLLRCPAAVRFLSIEPMLGPIDIDRWLDAGYESGGPAGWIPEPSVDWVIAGGESGAHARPFDLAWARSIRDQCQATGVACFVKQLGANPAEYTSGGIRLPVNLKDSHGGDWDEWPADLRVREFPRSEVASAAD